MGEAGSGSDAVARATASCRRRGRSGSGHQHAVDDMHDAVASDEVGSGYGGFSALGIGEHDAVAVDAGDQFAALHGGQFGLAARGFDRRNERGGVDRAGHHVVGQDAGQRGLVLGLEQGVDGAGGQRVERGVSRPEDGERASRRQGAG